MTNETNESLGICDIPALHAENNESWNLFKRTYRLQELSTAEIYIFTIIRLSIIVVGGFANCVLFRSAVWKHGQAHARPFDIFVANSAVANFLILVLGESGVAVQNILNGDWQIGDASCVVFLILQGIPYTFAVIFQLILSVDRILKIVFSLSIITSRRAHIVSVASWIIAGSSWLRLLLISRRVEITYGNCSFHFCRYDYIDPEYRSEIDLIAEYTFSIIIPFFAVLILNILLLVTLLVFIRRSRRQIEGRTHARLITKKEISAVKSIVQAGSVLIFCWFDFILIGISGLYFVIPNPIRKVGRLLGISYSAIIPFVYGRSYKSFMKRNRKIASTDSAQG